MKQNMVLGDYLSFQGSFSNVQEHLLGRSTCENSELRFGSKQTDSEVGPTQYLIENGFATPDSGTWLPDCGCNSLELNHSGFIPGRGGVIRRSSLQRGSLDGQNITKMRLCVALACRTVHVISHASYRPVWWKCRR